jgi:hypothetical protein
MTRQFQRMSRSAALGAAGGPAVPLRMPPEDQYIEDWWGEAVNVLLIASGGVANVNVQVQADSAFKLVKLGMQADIAAAAITDDTNPIPLVTMQMTDTGSGRNLFSNPIALGALFGNGRLPHILPVPRLFLPRSNIQMQFSNYSAATTYNIRMILEGTKVFKLGGSW